MSYRILTELTAAESALVDKMADLAGIDKADVPDWIGKRFMEELFAYAERYIAERTLAAGLEQANNAARQAVAAVEAVKLARFPQPAPE